MDFGYLPNAQIFVVAKSFGKEGRASFSTDWLGNANQQSVRVELSGGQALQQAQAFITSGFWGIIVLAVIAVVVIVAVKGFSSKIPRVKL